MGLHHPAGRSRLLRDHGSGQENGPSELMFLNVQAFMKARRTVRAARRPTPAGGAVTNILGKDRFSTKAAVASPGNAR
jgi:hypothetical protein